MDFTQYDSRAAAENGAWLHMRNPATGELLYDDGKPCMVKVQGSESRKVIKAMGAALKVRKPTVLADIEDNVAQNMADVRAQVMAFDNIDRGSKPAVVPDDVDWFLGLGIPVGMPAAASQFSFAEQIAEFARDRTSYLGNGSKP